MTETKLSPQAFYNLVNDFLHEEIALYYEDAYIRHEDIDGLIQALVDSVSHGYKTHYHTLPVYEAEIDRLLESITLRLWDQVFSWHDVKLLFEGTKDVNKRLAQFSDDPSVDSGNTVYIELLTAFGLLKPRQVFTDEEYKEIFV